MKDEQLKRIQNELIKEIDTEAKIEAEIKDSAEYAASNLALGPKVNIDINGKPYMLAYKVIDRPNGGRKIYMLATNLTLYQIMPKKYVPYTINVDVDDNYSMKDNLKAAVEAFIRHVTGRIKPDVLED